MTAEQVQVWIDAYVDAWRTYDAAAIGELFTQDAAYRYHPYDDPERGREAIVHSWTEEPDAPGSWEAEYRPLMIDGDRAVVTGETRYRDGEVFANLWVLEFDAEGRCSDFVEWYMEHP